MGSLLFFQVPEKFPGSVAEGRIAEAAAGLAAEEVLLRIALIRSPLVSSGPFGCDRDQRRRLAPLLHEAGARVVLSSRDRFYERSLPFLSGSAARPLIQVVSGGAGAALQVAGKEYWTRTSESVHHLVLFRATPERVTVTALDAEGKVLDRFVLGAGEEAEKAVRVHALRLAPHEKAVMKSLYADVAKLGQALDRGEVLGLVHRISEIHRGAAAVGAWEKGPVFGEKADLLLREARELSRGNPKTPEGRMLLGLGLGEVRRQCGRCHGLFD
jgi:hypothetical protein